MKLLRKRDLRRFIQLVAKNKRRLLSEQPSYYIYWAALSSYEGDKEEPTASTFHPEDGSSRLLPNVAKFLPHYMASHPRKEYCSFSMHCMEFQAL
jgi:hypothetical protein